MYINLFQLLVALKVRYPQRITILRGNHESRQVNLYQCISVFIYVLVAKLHTGHEFVDGMTVSRNLYLIVVS